ncbi:MAG: DMT family permease [Ignavibacteria bacterium]|nr:MAG: DMT family permease [Ignavibacteria bacterium]KAF0161519.1 MAG: DMT family permease [Ignavibacteria bacterium]
MAKHSKYFYKYTAEAALVLMTIIWGGTFVIVKESLNDISSMLFIAIRFAIASLLLIAFLFVKKIEVERNTILPGIMLGVFLFSGFFFQTLGLKLTTATKSGFITGTLIVFIPFVQILVERKFPSKGVLIGAAIVILGLLFLSSGGASIATFISELGASFNLGDMLTLICAFFFAVHIVYIDVYSPKHNFWVLLTTQLTTVAVLGFAASLLFFGLSVEALHIDLTKYLLFGLLYTSLLATLFNIGIQTRFQKVVSPTKAGIIYSFEPIFAAVFAFFLLGEKISNFGLLGCVLIFFGLIVAELFDSYFENKNESEPS